MRTDADLLREYLGSRSESAFAGLVERYGPMVYRTCLRILHNHQEAEDASQASFLVLAQQPPAANSQVSNWLHSVARHTSISAMRSRNRQVRREDTVAKTRNTVEPADPSGWREELDRALAQLPGRLREAVILRYFDGRSLEEAAVLAGCPAGTLGRRAIEGLQRLRETLGKRNFEMSAAALLALLATEAKVQVPASLLTALHFTTAGTASTTAVAWAKTMTQAMFWAKMKVYALGAAALIAASVAVPMTVKSLQSDGGNQTRPKTQNTTQSASWKPLFSGPGLTGWKDPWHGRWQSIDGVFVGEDPAGKQARLESEREFGDFELRCRMRVTGGVVMEFQVQSYNRFFTVVWNQPGTWKEVSLEVKNGIPKAVCDGRELPVQMSGGFSPQRSTGTISFYVGNKGRLEVTDAQIREVTTQ
jgi:RNA polymerase sigma factor (sigma-70 family)